MTIPGQFPTIPDHNTVRSADSRLCFSQECPVIYRNFSGINFMTIPGYSWKFLTTTKSALRTPAVYVLVRNAQ